MSIETGAPPDARRGAAPTTVLERLRSPAVTSWLLPLLLVAATGALRFYRLGHPERIYFDETYYATQAQEYLTRGVERDFAVHPPVGKWLIAGGIAATSYTAFGWRAAAAVAGTLLVLATYLIGLRLFRRRGVAALAAFLLSIDGLAFTMSRIAMLDIFLALFVAIGVWLLLLDRDTMWAGIDALPADPQRPLPKRPRRWRWLAGVAFGLAVATKLSAVLAIGGAGLFVLASELAWRRRVSGSPWTGWWRIVPSGLATLVLVPMVIYVLSYAGWFAAFPQTRPGQELCPDAEACAVAPTAMVNGWLGEQREIVRFHLELQATHDYRSPPWTWPLVLRPVVYYYESCTSGGEEGDPCVVSQGNVEEIIGLPNPAIWWLALLAYPLALWLAVVRRDWRVGTALGFFACQYLFWFFVARPNFIFYLTPAVPFLCLTLAYTLWWLARHPAVRWLPATVATLATAAFVFFYPVLVGQELARASWSLRMWLQSWI